MRKLWAATVMGILAMTMSAGAADGTKVLDLKVKSLAGDDMDLGKYKGKVLLIVNVASRCGATPQYEQLQALHEQYKDKGLVVIGVPCNQFGAQEPGDASQIAEFCKSKYDVTFDLLEKVDVNGDNASPLFKILTSTAPTTGPVKWNFEKFLVNKDGQVVGRFPTRVKPDAPEVLKAIEAELAK